MRPCRYRVKVELALPASGDAMAMRIVAAILVDCATAMEQNQDPTEVLGVLSGSGIKGGFQVENLTRHPGAN